MAVGNPHHARNRAARGGGEGVSVIFVIGMVLLWSSSAPLDVKSALSISMGAIGITISRLENRINKP